MGEEVELKPSPTGDVDAGVVVTFETVIKNFPGERCIAVWDANNVGDFIEDAPAIEVLRSGKANEWAFSEAHPLPRVQWDTSAVDAPAAASITAYVFTVDTAKNFIAFALPKRHPKAPTTLHLQEFMKAFSAAHSGLGEFEEKNKEKGLGGFARRSVNITVAPAPAAIPITEPTRVTLQRSAVPPTSDQALWTVIRNSTNALSFKNYSDFMDEFLCGGPAEGDRFREDVKIRIKRDIRDNRLRLPFPDVEAYRQLKVATEVFMMGNCGVVGLGALGAELGSATFDLEPKELDDESRRYERGVTGGKIRKEWLKYLEDSERRPGKGGSVKTLPYLAIIRRKLKDVDVAGEHADEREAAAACLGILMEKLTRPCFLELIWSYWHEEGMLVQTMNALTWRFQNRRGPADRDPLAMLEIDPLRPLNNFIWGYIQDEQHRLTVPRRTYEYDHHYGLTLLGKAAPQVRGADSRARFLEAFHQLLYVCVGFYKEDDDTTVVADGFPILNAIKEVHLLLTQGAHNQYGDLPWAARQEMLMQQWLLARPEMREFLPSRIMVDYPEVWMDRVETMKTMQGWTDTSILHFHDLGVFGENILLGIRFGAWPSVIEPEQAANWARYWRPEVQGYVHAYRAATGVDLTEGVDATLPGLLLRQRLLPQQGQTRLLSPQVQSRTTMQQATSRLLPGSRQPARTPAR